MDAAFLLSALEQLWSWFAVSLCIYWMGAVSKRVAKARGWHKADGWYDLTLRAHPLIAGIVFGFVPLPTLNAIDALPTVELVCSRCAWFMLAGALCGQTYEMGKFGIAWVKRRYGGDGKSGEGEKPADDDEAAEAADDEENKA
jgi:hypothetical protein